MLPLLYLQLIGLPPLCWSPTGESCRWPFLKWESFFFFFTLLYFFFFYKNSQNNHRTAGYFPVLTCVVPDKIGLENECLFTCSHKKATKRAILFAVVNNEAPVITSESEGACCVRPHIHQQPSDRLTQSQQVETCPEVARRCSKNHRVVAFFLFCYFSSPDRQ